MSDWEHASTEVLRDNVMTLITLGKVVMSSKAVKQADKDILIAIIERVLKQ